MILYSVEIMKKILMKLMVVEKEERREEKEMIKYITKQVQKTQAHFRNN